MKSSKAIVLCGKINHVGLGKGLFVYIARVGFPLVHWHQEESATKMVAARGKSGTGNKIPVIDPQHFQRGKIESRFFPPLSLFPAKQSGSG